MTDNLWHARDELLETGSLITPGRWGELVLSTGPGHPFYAREQTLEQWRVAQTGIRVSRLTSCYAFESRDAAKQLRPDEHQYRVAPQDPRAPRFRADMLWLTWMGEPDRTHEQMVSNCRSYWAGDSTADTAVHANPAWEWMFSCPLVVIAHVDCQELDTSVTHNAGKSR
jgi:hypothetical protein